MNQFEEAALPYMAMAAQDVGSGGAPSHPAEDVAAPLLVSSNTPAPLPVVQPVEIDEVRANLALLALHKALNTWATDADRLAQARNLPALADGLYRFRELRKAFRDLEQHVEDYVAGLMEQDQENIDDVITLERRRSWSRKQWRSVELLRELVGDQLVDARTGELVFDRLVACLPLTGSLSWRVGALRERGYDPGDWCDEEPSRTTVQVRARNDG